MSKKKSPAETLLEAAEAAGAARATPHCADAQKMGLVPTYPASIRPVQIPPPPPSPTETSPQALSEHLANAYLQACLWSGVAADDKDQRKRWYWQAYGLLSKGNFELTRKVQSALRTLKDGNSRLAFCIFAWWVVNRATEEGKQPSPMAVFAPDKLLSAKHRAWYHKDCSMITNQPSLWPVAADNALACLVEWSRMSPVMQSPKHAAEVWATLYAARWKAAVELADTQSDRIRERLDSAVWKYDLGVWLSLDVPAHLKVSAIVSTTQG